MQKESGLSAPYFNEKTSNQHSVLRRALVVGIAAMSVLATASQASAVDAQTESVGCYGDWCSGRDPVETGCAKDARTIANSAIIRGEGSIGSGVLSKTFGGGAIGQVEVQWSETCKTHWARLNLIASDTIRRLTIRQEPDNRGYEQSIKLLGKFQYILRPGLYNTPMIYSKGKHVRGFAYFAELPLPQTISTPWV